MSFVTGVIKRIFYHPRFLTVINRIMKALTCIIASFLIAHTAQSQNDTTKAKVQFRFGAYYNSNLNYYGRTDSLRSSGVFPLAELWLNNKFYINAAPVFVNNADGNFQYAGTVATIGYSAKTKNEKFLNSLYITKPFYKNTSTLVQSALDAQAGASSSWQNKVLNITGGADIKVSDKVDYGFMAGLDHLFRHEFPDNFILVVDPSAYVYAGTQQFTKTYYRNSSFLFLPASEREVTEQVTAVNILSYEFSMPVVLAKNKLQIILLPAYVLPQNLIQVQNRPDLSERGKNMFYATVGAKVNF